MWDFYGLNYDIDLSIGEMKYYTNQIIDWLKKRKKEIEEKNKLKILRKKVIQEINEFHSSNEPEEKQTGFLNWFFV